MDVGVRELKQNLSKYLDRAESGELIRVTDRGRPKVLLGPLPDRAVIDKGIEEGWITPGAGGPLEPRSHRAKSPVSIAQMLEEDRGE